MSKTATKSSKTETLAAQARAKLGTRQARKLRVAGRIPASMDGDGDHAHHHFSIEEHGFLAARRRHVHLFDLELSGKTESALVRELQWDALGDYIIHIDFKRVRKDVETEAEVELEFTGHPKGGMLNHLFTHVTVRCLPGDIPDSIEVPVGHLETGGGILARELVLPAGIKLVTPLEALIANVVIAKVEVVATPVVAPVAEGGTVAATPATPTP
jgi:large subunit ribosomal protein L25